MIEKLLNEDLIEIGVEVNRWEDAVIKSGELLLKNNKVDSRYISAMIDTVNEMGPYIVMAPGIAMPHARPEYGAKNIGLSVIVLKNSVNFGNDEFDPVRIVFAICAIGHESHIELLQDLSLILDDNRLVSKASECRSKKELINVLIEIYENNK